ncbi:MAG: polysaccharide deacetylase family protein [Desulfobacteraceae bacterium]|nr:MAG: polysaccharide deacetylase family protein [Desulfobacteraceae bacterium]
MQTLTIHDFRKDYFKMDLKQYRLSFDDGLYSQFYYFPMLEELDTELIFFIVTSFVRPGPPRKLFDGRHPKFPKSRDCMYDAHVRGRFDPFMTTEEIQYLASQKNVRIGAHSHFHDVVLTAVPLKKPNSRWKIEKLPDLPEDRRHSQSIRSRIAFRGYEAKNGGISRRSTADWIDYMKYDTECCIRWFHKHLGFQPTLYSFPFNEYNPLLVSILKSFGFETLFNGRKSRGSVSNRLDIDMLAATLGCIPENIDG